MNPLLLLLICLLFAAPTIGQTQLFESHEQIMTAVTTLIDDNLDADTDKQIHITPLDRRLRMAKCSQPLNAFTNPGTRLLGKTTIGVRCSGDKPWKIYVTATISLFKEVVIINEPILRGTALGNEQLRLEKRNIASLSRGYFTDYKQVTGKVAKYTLNPENVVTPAALTMPKLVQRGKNVTIIAHNDDITVKMNGEAMADGHMGDLIKVKNQRSQRIIQARVIDNNIVGVDI